MPTFLQLRDATANLIGRSDGGTDNTIRDNAINDVVRFEIANAHPFSWNRKTDATLNLDASGQDDLPSDFNPTHKLYDVRKVYSGQGGDNVFHEVPRETFDSYTAGSYRYYLDYNTSTDLWRINTTEASIAITVVYSHRPAIMTTTTDVCRVPDQDTVAYLAAARYLLGSKADETNHDRVRAIGLQHLLQLVNIDKRANPLRPTRSRTHSANLGWNR